MAFNHKMFDWQNQGAEPSAELKQSGFQAGYKPPATVFNNFWYKTSNAITELQTTFDGHTHTQSEVTGLTDALANKANADLSNIDDDAFLQKVQNAGAGGIPIVNAASTDGVAYTATLDNVTALSAGLAVWFIPGTTTTSTAPTFNLNGLGAKSIRRKISLGMATTSGGGVASWLYKGRPFLLVYDGTYWIAEGMTKPGADDLYGSLAATKVGLSDTTATALGLDSGANVEDALGQIMGEDFETTTATMPSSNSWNLITYGKGKFVVVTNTATAAYSEDGITWESATMPSSKSWYSVAYGNGKFVAVANSSNAAAYSEDGITWKSATLPITTGWASVTYGNGKFVAVPLNSANAAYSEDGITWKSATMPGSDKWQAVTYGNGKFVAVANSSNAAYSEDGITWESATMPSSKSWYSVAYGNGKFVAVSNSSAAAYSEDGITWESATMPSSTVWHSVAYGDGKFVAVSYSSTGSNAAAYSEDGITWKLATLPISDKWYSVAYGNGKFVAVTYTSNKAVVITIQNSLGFAMKSELEAAKQSSTKVVVGSYVGTGTAGSANPVTLTFGNTPKIFVMWGGATNSFADEDETKFPVIALWGVTIKMGYSYSSSSACNLSYTDNSISWYVTSGEASHQFNSSGVTYNYAAIF